ncbi:MAG: hypothetical protein O2968_21095 [Acidobacteria bacterium]|nr:hypothetical protein [Acidobacteriota bacterium]
MQGTIVRGAFGVVAVCFFLFAGCGADQVAQPTSGELGKSYAVVAPGVHPGIIFSEQELPALQRRARGSGPAADAYRKIKQIAVSEFDLQLAMEQAVGRKGERAAKQLEAMALVYQIERDEKLGRKATELFRSLAADIDPAEFYRAVGGDFFATEHWPKAFAFAWDWLYHVMTPEEREAILRSLEQWNTALFDHTESSWWREAGYNCGAIPVGAQGLLLTAIQAETRHPQFSHWFSQCFRKVSKNYFPLTWREDGGCNEGPGYAHYHKNPTQFAEAVRRTGGPDIIGASGAVNAMHYLRHQWMPQGECGPVGDNTNYGPRVFQSIYLHGIRELRDQAGLWTYLNYTDFDRIDPVLFFLVFPDDLEPASPGALNLRTSHYFEIDRDRAGNVFARSEWDNPEAAWFAFVTRYAEANHTHYDMNSFLFSAFGEQFATHDNVYPYSSEHHGVDFEHNIVIIDDGGMPAADRQSAGDDGSMNGLMAGIGLGRFADYVRGDAHLSYADRSVPSSVAALRADRSVLFVKQGPNPYIVVADEIRKDDAEHDYHWQWYTPALAVSGNGSIDDLFLIKGKNAHCKIAMLAPETPKHDFRRVTGGHGNRPVELGLLRVNRRGVEAEYLAVAAAWREDSEQPSVRRGPEIQNHPNAVSIVVDGGGFHDLIVRQRPGDDDHGIEITSGKLYTDALTAVVRTNAGGVVTGYLMGEGSILMYDGKKIAAGPHRFSVSADAKRTVITGPRQARKGMPPIPAEGVAWLPEPVSEVWVDEVRMDLAVDSSQMVVVGE